MSNPGHNSSLTIAAKHQEIINKFNDKKKSIKELKQEIEIKNKKLKDFIPNEQLEKCDILKKLDIEDDIKEIKNKIKQIESGSEEDNYFINTSHILYKYFDNIKSKPKINKTKTKSNKNCIHSSLNTKSITDFFEKNKPKINDNVNANDANVNANINANVNANVNIIACTSECYINYMFGN